MSNTVRERLALARGLVSRDELTAAEELFQELAAEFPNFADIHHEIGLFYHHLNDFERARAAFGRALEINPRYTAAALNLAITLNDLGRYEDARAIYEKAVTRSKGAKDQLDPFVAGKIANLYAEIGDAYEAAGMPARAVTAFRQALELGPSFHDIRVRLAQALLDTGDGKGAVAELTRAVEEHPELLSAQIALGLALYSTGDKDGAVARWLRVLAREPDNRHAQMYLRLTTGNAAG